MTDGATNLAVVAVSWIPQKMTELDTISHLNDLCLNRGVGRVSFTDGQPNISTMENQIIELISSTNARVHMNARS